MKVVYDIVQHPGLSPTGSAFDTADALCTEATRPKDGGTHSPVASAPAAKLCPLSAWRAKSEPSGNCYK